LALENYYLQKQVGGTKADKQRIRMLFWYTIHRIEEIHRIGEEEVFADFYKQTQNNETGKKLVGGAKAFQLCMYIMLFRRDLLMNIDLNRQLPCPLADIITQILSLPESDIDYTTSSDKMPNINVTYNIKELSTELQSYKCSALQEEINEKVLKDKLGKCKASFDDYWNKIKYDLKAKAFAKQTIAKIENLRGNSSYDGVRLVLKQFSIDAGVLEEFGIDTQNLSLLNWIKSIPYNRELFALLARDAHIHLGHTFMPNLHEPRDFEKIKSMLHSYSEELNKFKFTEQEYIKFILKTMINYAIKKDLTSNFTRINSMAGVALFVEDLQQGLSSEELASYLQKELSEDLQNVSNKLFQNWKKIYAQGGLYNINRNIPPPTQVPAMQDEVPAIQDEWAETLKKIVNKAKDIISNKDYFPKLNLRYQIISSKPCGKVIITNGQKITSDEDLQSILFSQNTFDVPNILCNAEDQVFTELSPWHSSDNSETHQQVLKRAKTEEFNEIY